MKNISACLLILFSLLIGACKKDVVPAYSREKPHQQVKNQLHAVLDDSLLSGNNSNLDFIPLRTPPIPFRPDTLRPFPRLPKGIPLPLFLNAIDPCINSLDDLQLQIGSGPVDIKSVVLYNGATLYSDQQSLKVTYEAVPEVRGSSLFRSQMQVEWQPGPFAYWSGFTADVWTLGCVHLDKAIGPFTNILRGGAEILINTCFFWAAPPYQHERIKYLVLD